MGKQLIEMEKVSVTVKGNQILNNITCKMPIVPGVIGLIGPNGAGKTTFILTLLNQYKYKGFCNTFSLDEIGYCADTPSFDSFMTSEEVIKQSANLKGIEIKDQEVNTLLQDVGLAKDCKSYVEDFSRGMKQRLGIAAAMVGNPQIIFLDEPTSALDPIGREVILNLIEKLADNTTVIVSSHLLNDVQKISKALIVLNKGNLIFEGTKNKFITKYNKESVFTFTDLDKVINVLRKSNLNFVREEKNKIKVNQKDFDKVYELVESRYIEKIERNLDLNSIFFKLINGG